MAAIANQNGRNMVQHVLLPININFHWNVFIFEFLTIFFIFILAAILLGVNLTFLAPWLLWQRPPFWIISTPQKLPHTTVDISTKFHEFWWKESRNFRIPFFCFHGKLCPTDSNLFALSRSTKCGCCSYQVSSISVWRVSCYDHFCVFHFFSMLAVSMTTADILKKSTLKGKISHGIWYSYEVS